MPSVSSWYFCWLHPLAWTVFFCIFPIYLHLLPQQIIKSFLLFHHLHSNQPICMHNTVLWLFSLLVSNDGREKAKAGGGQVMTPIRIYFLFPGQ